MKAIREVNTAHQNSHASLLPTLLDASLFSGQTIDIRSDWRHEVDAESDRGAQRSRHCSRSRLARSGCSCCCRCSCQLLLLLLNAWLFRTKPHSLAGQSGFYVEVLTLETATAARVVFAACASATTANIHLKTCDNKRKLALHKITFHKGPDFERST